MLEGRAKGGKIEGEKKIKMMLVFSKG